ncbi:hypothetical protein ACTMTJ_45000 [Phytohabitans sp. LJ34]|uniref:hypothetical protein n=1 Tax=Phytohabitans sp. LJ34 TaxID=3452217 RepID=UPI003F8CE36E
MLLESTTATDTTAAIRRPAWKLALSPLAFVAWLVAVVATMSGTGVSDSADLTPDQMDGIRVGWALMWPVYAIAVLLGLSALYPLNRLLRGRLATASQVFVAVAAVAILANLVLSEVAAGFGEARLGDNAAYEASLVASYASIWAATVATILTAVALRTSGLLRRAGLVVAILAGALLVLDVATRGLPPFMVALFWVVLGVGLLRRRVPSSV